MQRGRSPAAGRSRSTRLPESVETITIDRLAAGGDGVGRVHGLAVFVPRTAPGDVAQIAYATHARHGRGRVLQLLAPSPARVAARCRHYEQDRCGGCQLQHLDAATQQRARQEIVQESLRRIGRREIALPPIVSDAQWEYRGRLTLTLQQRGSGWIGGLHPHDDPTRIFPLEECAIAHPALVAAWQALRPMLRSNAPALPDAPSLRLALRLDDRTAEDVGGTAVALVLQGGAAWPDRDAWMDAARHADRLITQVLWTPHASDGAATVPAVDLAPAAQEALAFAQVNPVVANALHAFVFAEVMALAPRRVIDAYAGTGRLATQLAEAGVDVVVIEADAAGAEAGVARVRAAGAAAVARVQVICDLVERALPMLGGASARPDVVVLNPPRRGVDAAVTQWLEDEAQRSVRGVIYVSCDPGTLARDLTRLPSWRVAAVQCFDMFPQTAHVETVCVLLRESA
jgi:23S rRNA (uracil1939-C5)-methyltransferase